VSAASGQAAQATLETGNFLSFVDEEGHPLTLGRRRSGFQAGRIANMVPSGELFVDYDDPPIASFPAIDVCYAFENAALAYSTLSGEDLDELSAEIRPGSVRIIGSFDQIGLHLSNMMDKNRLVKNDIHYVGYIKH
jgi:hypothetical protein